MNSDLGFSKPSLFLIVVGLLGAWWILVGGPIPVAKVQSLKPDSRLSTYEDRMAEQLSRDRGRAVKPKEVAAMVLEGVAYSLINSANVYMENPCDPDMRRYIVGRIKHYHHIKRRFPGVVAVREKIFDLPVSDENVRQTFSVLASKGLLVRGDFDAETGNDLGKGRFSAEAAKVKQHHKCQAANSGD